MNQDEKIMALNDCASEISSMRFVLRESGFRNPHVIFDLLNRLEKLLDVEIKKVQQ